MLLLDVDTDRCVRESEQHHVSRMGEGEVQRIARHGGAAVGAAAQGQSERVRGTSAGAGRDARPVHGAAQCERRGSGPGPP